ncbi:MAG: hypothetical protein MI806_19580 [Minwuiales bacterium]|nr:hypothetical protein [Minwuiales bacterium]
MRIFSHKHRPVHLGPYPLERLPRVTSPNDRPPRLNGATPPGPAEDAMAGPFNVAPAMADYVRLFDSLRDGEIASTPAPIPRDPQVLADNLKAGIYFLDADMAGSCEIPEDAWQDGGARHRYAVVVLVAFTREVGPDEPGAVWIRGTQQDRANLRAAEIAVITAGYIRQLGHAARAHTATATELDLGRVALQAGLCEIRDGAIGHPYLGSGFGVGVVSTDLEIAPDRPLAARGLGAALATKGPGYWLGAGGAKPGWKWLADETRPLHLGKYPMEKIKRVPETTTLITDQVPRVPKRANFFTRALHGDLGEKPKRERNRFALKTPSAMSYVGLIRGMVPIQDGQVAEQQAPGSDDAQANTDAVKALATYLGGDMVGICEAADFAWYSHHDDGTPIEPYHKYAVVILVDQGYETMEGASGDDWISGAQSMRAYMRGAEIAGVMAAHLRSLGHSAKSHTNADSDVLHIPLVLLAGLGELSRIGELVLNPFVGPRFKSVVVTTDLPLIPDRPIDFGLQDFCDKCNKCARECPCSAIAFGDKTMFNGYEMWKPDVEKCVRYRVTNPKGSACGRCMKTCPYNTEGLLSQRLFLWMAIKLPFMRQRIAIWDDKVGNGTRNPIKRWWFDLEVVDGVTVEPTAGTNERDLNFDNKMTAETQRMAHYPADTMPPPDAVEPFPPNRKAAMKRAEAAETPAEARARLGE